MRIRPYRMLRAAAVSTLVAIAWPASAQEFGAPALLSNAEQNNDSPPGIVTDGNGTWVAAWGSNDTLGGTVGADFDILFRRSTDNGATWSAIAALNTNATSDTGFDALSEVVHDGAGHWAAIWYSQDSPAATHGVDRDIFLARSNDQGMTWTARALLNTNGTGDTGDDESPRIAVDGSGHWVAVWRSTESLGGTIGTDTDILVSRSANHGQTWTAPVALNANAAFDSTIDSSPRVTTDGLGNWIAVWESTNTFGGTVGPDYELLFARSTDNGATWTAPALFNTNAASDSGWDRGVEISIDSLGNWVAVWYSDNFFGSDDDILVARSQDAGATWTAPAALNSLAATDSQDDLAPRITTDKLGNWVVAWNSFGSLGTLGPDYDVVYARSTDNGVTWTAAAALNTNAASDSGTDAGPDLATDGLGHWIAGWRSDDPLDGSAGPLHDDVFLALGTLCGDGLAVADEQCDGGDCCTTACFPNSAGTACGSDGNSCTDDECDESGLCTHPGNNASCDDGLFCNGADACASSSCSLHDGNPCASGGECANTCIEASDSCNTPALTACTNDGSVCSDDVCDGSGACTHPAANAGAQCRGDAGACDVAEQCDGVSPSCPPNDFEPDATPCNDSLPCTILDQCTAGTCSGSSTLCGDGNVQTSCGEQCDDGAAPGDGCCSPACLFQTAGTACADDGVACTEDVCDGTGSCGVGDDNLCGDGNPCTHDTCNADAGCQAVAQPLDPSACFAAPKSRLQVRYTSDSQRNRVAWQWTSGDGFDQDQLGTPTVDTTYTLCVYDSSSSSPLLPTTLDIEPSASRWTDEDPKGLRYKDRDGLSDGVSRLQLKTGADGRTRAKLSAGGPLVPLSAPAGDTYFQQESTVVAQLQNTEGACWTTEFALSDVKRHDAESFKAQTK